jgi:hypothetical protein
MVPKESAGKQPTRPRLSRASRLLGSVVRSTVRVPLPEEPWRNRKQNGNHGSKNG